MSRSFSNHKSRLRQNKGQIVIEYVLLLMVAIVLALLLVRGLISRDPEQTGALIRAWSALIEVIRTDQADDIVL